MEFKALYPEDDKSNLSIEKIDNESVKFLFKVLPEYTWRIAITLSTTIWGFHSWWEHLNPNLNKYLNEIIKITNKNDDIIYKDPEYTLKIMRSTGSDDITISSRFTKPKILWEEIEITINKANSNPEIIDNLFSILSTKKDIWNKYWNY